MAAAIGQIRTELREIASRSPRLSPGHRAAAPHRPVARRQRFPVFFVAWAVRREEAPVPARPSTCLKKVFHQLQPWSPAQIAC